MSKTAVQKATHVYPAIMADDVSATRDFYVRYLSFEVIFDSDWYAQLEAHDDSKTQIGIVEREHSSVPAGFRERPAGVLISVEVDDVDAVYAKIQDSGLEIPLELRSEDFGQRHFMTVDPAGTLVDVITLIPATDEYNELGRTS